MKFIKVIWDNLDDIDVLTPTFGYIIAGLTSLWVLLVLLSLCMILTTPKMPNKTFNANVDTEAMLSSLLDTTDLIKSNLELQKRVLQLSVITVNRVSCYTPSSDECDDTPHITSINSKPIPGWTAAVSHDLSFLLGKKIFIKGIGVRYINDLMNSRYEKSIDLCEGSKTYCRNFGIKENLKLIVLN